MSALNGFAVSPGWKLLLKDAGLNADRVLRRAGLPGDLFSRQAASLNTEGYFRLWQAMDEECGEDVLALRIARTATVEAFDPPLFAAMCSPDLNTALRRLSQHKRLMYPMALHIDQTEKFTTMRLEWLDKTVVSPPSLVGAELAFFVYLARTGTREQIFPYKVRSPVALEPVGEFEDYFGTKPQKGTHPELVFHAADASRPFLTANEAMWEFFEPDLKRRLSELDTAATTADRVQAALLELIPGGGASMDSVSSRLGTSSRTLQRRLKSEGRSFQELLNNTREKLARHYLTQSSFSGAEISFLLGFDDPNSFFRAFHDWTGKTPNQVRAAR